MLTCRPVLNEITSGGATVNDSFFHACITTLAFGGVGDSGQGAYRGKASFDTFTHRRSITTTPNWMEKLLDVRYPPYAGKLSKFRMTSELRPNFDRQGNEITGVQYWLGFVFRMGGENTKEVLVRWAITALVAVVAKKYADVGKLPSYLK
jgi:beta-apo-4'-carotenal oxygenase